MPTAITSPIPLATDVIKRLSERYAIEASEATDHIVSAINNTQTMCFSCVIPKPPEHAQWMVEMWFSERGWDVQFTHETTDGINVSVEPLTED